MAEGHAWVREADVGLLGGFLTDGDARKFGAGVSGEPRARGSRGHPAQKAFGGFHNLFVFDIASHNEHQVLGHVLRAEVTRYRLEGSGFDRLGRAADVATDGLTGPKRLVDQNGGKFCGAIFNAGQFLENDGAFLFELGRIHHRFADHIAEDIDGLGCRRVGDLRVVDRHLTIRGRIVHAADGFDGLRDVARRGAPGRPLEQHVFEKVRKTGFVVGLVAAAGTHVHAHGRRTRVGKFSGHNSEAVGKNCPFKHGVEARRSS